jgi:CheY-like chemotaxis protein
LLQHVRGHDRIGAFQCEDLDLGPGSARHVEAVNDRLNARDVEMLSYAEVISNDASQVTQEHIEQLRAVGFTDVQICDIALCAAVDENAVEDDDDVRANTTGILRELGYTVLEASLAASALHLLERHPEIRLLFTDIGLPGGMNGRQLADAARKIRPDLKVLFTTGYARNAIVHDGRLDPGIVLIPKPFTYAAVAAKLADLLDEPKGPPRILLVEDEVLVRMVATDQLEDLGYRVDTAGSATEAMNKLKLMEGDIALAIVDIGLPDIKGDVLVGELRLRHPDLPIIVASGYDDPALLKRFANDARVSFTTVFFTIASNPVVWVVACAYACTGAVRQGIDQWFPRFMSEAYHVDFQSAQFQLIGFLIPFVASAGSLVSGYVSDTLFQGRRAPVAAGLYLIETAIILLAAQFHTANAAVVFLVLISFTANATHSILGTAAAMDIGGAKMAGFATGVIDSFQYIVSLSRCA